jgi:hypothetical protein
MLVKLGFNRVSGMIVKIIPGTYLKETGDLLNASQFDITGR